MKHSLAVMAAAAVLVATLAACGAANDKSALPSFTGGSSPSTSAPSVPATTPTKQPPAIANGPVGLAAHSTYKYGGLTLVVDLPADLPRRARPSMQLFSAFLQADGKTTARSKLDPALLRLASAEVIKELQAGTGGESVQAIGATTYTISKIRTSASGFAMINGCLNQSKLVQVRKDGSRFADTNTKKYPTLKMTANISPQKAGSFVTLFTFAPGSC